MAGKRAGTVVEESAESGRGKNVSKPYHIEKPLISDAMWTRLEPHLPAPVSRGRPFAPNREVLEGILWVLKTGARWQDLPAGYPNYSTCWRRLTQWEEQGVWLDLWRAYLEELDHRGRVDWEECFIDGSFAPAKKGATASAKPRKGREQSGWWWSTARVFLWEFTSARPPRRKSGSQSQPSARSSSKARRSG